MNIKKIVLYLMFVLSILVLGEENYKSLNYKYEANEYSGSYYFKNLELTIFFEKCGRKKIVDWIDISLPYEDNPNILDVGKILKLDILKNIFNNN